MFGIETDALFGVGLGVIATFLFLILVGMIGFLLGRRNSKGVHLVTLPASDLRMMVSSSTSTSFNPIIGRLVRYLNPLYALIRIVEQLSLEQYRKEVLEDIDEMRAEVGDLDILMRFRYNVQNATNKPAITQAIENFHAELSRTA